ncbi:hypothetical protein FQA39_LY07172 [Lamprigera yunnana]|nr:hypothetical protein FQA39_LY07172 [Lamprigera yunnana]
MATAKVYAALVQLKGLDVVSSSGAQRTEDRRAAVLAHLGNLLAQIIHPPELPTFSGDRREDITEFFNNMERYFRSCSIPEDRQLTTLAKQLRGKAAKFWADNQYFVTEYAEFVQWREVIRSRPKKENEAALSVPQEETQTATPASTDAKVKCEAEPEPSQKEAEVTQLNAYTTAASEVATDKLETANS